MNMPRVKKNKETTYDEFIHEVRLNNLKTIKRIFNTTDEVTECILKNYEYQICDGTSVGINLRQVIEDVFCPNNQKNLNYLDVLVASDMKNDYQRKLYWKIWFESFAKAFERVENEVCGMSKKEKDKFLEWDTWLGRNYILKKIKNNEKRYLKDIYEIKNDEFDGKEYLKYYFKDITNRQNRGKVFFCGESYLDGFDEMYSSEFALKNKNIEEINEWFFVDELSIANINEKVIVWKWNRLIDLKAALNNCKCETIYTNEDDLGKQFKELKDWLTERIEQMWSEIEYMEKCGMEDKWCLRIEG